MDGRISSASRRSIGSGRREFALLLGGTLLLFLVRLALSRLRHGPILVADEVDYLLNARVLTGGERGELSLAGFSHGGYSLLLAPLVALHAGPATVYRLVLVVNAVLAALLAPLLYALLTRVFRVAPRAAVPAALVAAAYPSVTVWSQVALAENLLLPLTVVWLLLFALVLEARSSGRAAAHAALFGFCGAALYATHGRMIVAAALTVVVLPLLALGRRLPPLAAAAGLAVAGAGIFGAHVLDDYLVSRNWGGHTASEIGTRISSIRDVSGILAIGRNLVGQTWYLAVAGLGVLVLAALLDAPGFARRLRRREHDTRTLVLLLLLLLGAGLLAVSVLSFPTVDRPDVLIYGRYVEIALPPLLALALVRLAGREARSRLAAALVVVVALTVAVAGIRAGVHPPRAPNRWNVAALPFLTLQLGTPSLVGAGVVAAGVLVVVAVLRRRAPRLLVPAVLLVFAATTAVAEHNPVLSGDRAVYPGGWSSPAPVVQARRIAYDRSAYDVIGLFVYQWYLPHTRFVLYSGTGRPPAQYVISSAGWARRHRGVPAHAVWRDPGRNQLIFRLTRRP
jgi:hypothetical protein